MADFYNIEEIRSELTALVRKSNFESARQLYTERIMDWTDYYTENLCNNDDNNTSEDINIAIRSICQLWIDFAEMEINQKQYKKASQIFDKAIEDPIVKTSSSIYLRYSSFCEIINKLGYARTILIRGLTSQLSQVDADFLWVELLQIVQKLGSPNLTMQLLYDAIVLEKSTENVTKPSDALLNLMEVDVASSHPLITENILTNTTDIATNNVIKTQSVTMETMPLPVEHVVNIARNYDDVSYLTPEQLTSTFVTRPPMLFNFSDQDLRSGALTESELRELEAFFGQGLPRDAVEFQAHANSKLRVVADTIEALWVTQALKERHFNHWFSELQALHTEERKSRDKSRLNMDPGVAESRADVQLEVLHCVVNKTLYALLVEQQTVLTSIKFPRFSKEQTDSIIRKYDSVKSAEIISSQKRFVAAVARLQFNPTRGNVSTQDPEVFYSLDAKNSRRQRRMLPGEAPL